MTPESSEPLTAKLHAKALVPLTVAPTLTATLTTLSRRSPERLRARLLCRDRSRRLGGMAQSRRRRVP
jgi:hypothetical protein